MTIEREGGGSVRRGGVLILLLVSALGAGGCGLSRVQSMPLYDRLGGQSGIERIVDGMLLAISEDERIAHHFAESNILRLRAKLIEQLCAESGGPCTYTGDSMRASHAGHGYRDADFNAVVEALQRAMREQGIAGGDQNRLLGRLAPLRREIVED